MKIDHQSLSKDTNALIKFIMIEIEDAASESPEEALHPYIMEKRRKRIVNKVWDLIRKAMSMMGEF